jgi:hypothetical protein
MVPAGAVNPREHIGSAEVDGTTAAGRRSVLDEDDLFIVTQAPIKPVGKAVASVTREEAF